MALPYSSDARLRALLAFDDNLEHPNEVILCKVRFQGRPLPVGLTEGFLPFLGGGAGILFSRCGGGGF